MIRSLFVTIAAATLCVLLMTGCEKSDPRQAGHDQTPRPMPSQPQKGPGVGEGGEMSQSGNAAGGGVHRGGSTGGTTPTAPGGK
jgi:hypothetical protein